MIAFYYARLISRTDLTAAFFFPDKPSSLLLKTFLDATRVESGILKTLINRKMRTTFIHRLLCLNFGSKFLARHA